MSFKILEKLKNNNIQVILVIIFYILFAQSLNNHINQIFYTISTFIKDILNWFMPIIVAVFIADTINSFKRNILVFLLVLILFEITSNFFSVMYSYGAGFIVSNQIKNFEAISTNINLIPLWRLPLVKPNWWGAENGAILGLSFGCISSYFRTKAVETIIIYSRFIVEIVLTKFFSKIIPIFILGFVAQIYETGTLNNILFNYSMLIIYLIPVLLTYIFIIFLIGNNLKINLAIKSIHHLLPSALISFTSCCRISIMPIIISATAKNLKNPKFADTIIPATINIQQIGDCIVNSFLCFLIYRNFFGYNPDIVTWLKFTSVFIFARFATAAVVGGAIFLMLPIYQHYLHFSNEMIAMIIAFNVILDPIVTSSNVLANGGLAKIFEMVWFLCIKKKSKL